MTRNCCVASHLLVALLPGLVWLSCAHADVISDDAQQVYEAALAAYRTAHLVDAEQGFLKAAQLAPCWGVPNGRLGVMYQVQGKQTQALEQYAQVQKLSFASADAPVTETEVQMRALLIENEAYMIYLVNSARMDEGLPPLLPDAKMAIVARGHSEEMRDKNYFGHDSPTPGLYSCQDRFNCVFGYRPPVVGENVARRWGSQFCLCANKILQTHRELMNSPGHRHNILLPVFEWLGVGIAANSNGDYWVTEIFAKPKAQ